MDKKTISFRQKVLFGLVHLSHRVVVNSVAVALGLQFGLDDAAEHSVQH